MLIRCYGARGSLPVSGPEYLMHGGEYAEFAEGADLLIHDCAGDRA
jgi:hypothetical protein